MRGGDDNERYAESYIIGLCIARKISKRYFFVSLLAFSFKFSTSLFQLHLMLSGARIGYFSGDIKRLLEDCKELQ